MGFGLFVNNLRYLFRYNIKDIYKTTKLIISTLDFLKYELKDDLENLFIPKILNNEETVDYIINNKVSVARFGDGEFHLINLVDIPFQKSSHVLAEKLKNILISNDENIAICIPYNMCHSVANLSDRSKNFIRTFYGSNNKWIMQLLSSDKIYLNSGFTILPSSEEKYQNIRKIWNNRNITVISGNRVFKKIKYNIFDNAKTVEYIKAPTVNAFEKYEKILAEAKKINKDRLILLILGPTATVLAFDLAKEGYQAIDIGHLVKSYDTFKKNVNITPEFLSTFFAKD